FTSARQLPRPTCVALSPSGRMLAVARANVVTVIRWPDRPGYHELPLQAPAPPARALAFSHDGRLLAGTESDDTVIVWDITKDRPSHLQGHTGRVLSVAFSRDGKLIASAGQDKT